MQVTNMRELNADEINDVSGGVLFVPFLIAGAVGFGKGVAIGVGVGGVVATVVVAGTYLADRMSGDD